VDQSALKRWSRQVPGWLQAPSAYPGRLCKLETDGTRSLAGSEGTYGA